MLCTAFYNSLILSQIYMIVNQKWAWKIAHSSPQFNCIRSLLH
jgi:hypothetical protein